MNIYETAPCDDGMTGAAQRDLPINLRPLWRCAGIDGSYAQMHGPSGWMSPENRRSAYWETSLSHPSLRYAFRSELPLTLVCPSL